MRSLLEQISGDLGLSHWVRNNFNLFKILPGQRPKPTLLDLQLSRVLYSATREQNTLLTMGAYPYAISAMYSEVWNINNTHKYIHTTHNWNSCQSYIPAQQTFVLPFIPYSVNAESTTHALTIIPILSFT